MNTTTELQSEKVSARELSYVYDWIIHDEKEMFHKQDAVSFRPSLYIDIA